MKKTIYVAVLLGDPYDTPKFFFETLFSAKRWLEIKVEDVHGDGSNNTITKAGADFEWRERVGLGGHKIYGLFVKPRYPLTPRDHEFTERWRIYEVTNERDVFVEGE